MRPLLDLALSKKLALLLALTVLCTLGLGLLAGTLPIESALARALLVGALLVPALLFGVRRIEPLLEEPVRRLARDAREAVDRPEGNLEPRPSDGAGERMLAALLNELLVRLRERENLLERGRATFEGEVAARTLVLAQHNERLQYAMEEARAAALLKAQLLANMSHELRTPMNGILGMNDLLLDSSISDQQRSYAEIIKSSAESLLEIIADILDFSKMEAGKLQLDSIEFDLHRTVEEVVQLLSGAAIKKELRLSCTLAPDVPRSVRGDPTRLRQVLTNLIGNAVKFTEHGHVTVEVGRAEELDGRVRLRFQVQDTGMGIPQDRQLQMFLPFSQVDPSATRRHGGTGLGLSISKQLVELLGGQIGLQSELGVGSVFWFTAVFELGTTGLFRSIVLPDGVTLPRVLVAEGSTATREVLHQQLAAWGFEHEVVSDAERALGALRRALEAGRPFGVCLLDTELSSAELQAFLRERPRTFPILLSWSAEDADGIPGEKAQVLRKPVRPSALYDALMAVLDSDALAVSPEDVDPIPAGPAGDEESSALRVLLAEDNQVNQTVAVKILARGGFRCDVVADGRAAVQAAQREPYDVVLMDCQMPELDGFEAVREIRRFEGQHPDRRRVHVIALTANAMEGDRERCLEAGMDDYLPKPVKPAHLLERLRQRARLAAGAPRRSARVQATVVEPLSEVAAAQQLRQARATAASQRVLDLARELEGHAGARRLDRVESILDALRSEIERCRASLPEEPPARPRSR